MDDLCSHERTEMKSFFSDFHFCLQDRNENSFRGCVKRVNASDMEVIRKESMSAI